MAGSDAQRLLERLIGDPDFRDRFEVDPAETARGAGFGRLAHQLATDDRDPMQTLELRESRSSLAGALMAAAAEAVGLVAFEGRSFGADAHAARSGVGHSPAARLAARAERVGGRDPVGSDAELPVVAEDTEVDVDEPPDEEEPDEEEPDEEEPDEEEPDEEEPDEEEPDEEEGEDDDSEDDDSEDDDSEDDDSEDDDTGGESLPGLGGDGLGEAPLTPVDYPGDDASQQEMAAWMAASAQRRGLPPELPVMAALVESGLKNVDHGDADSVGLFQMRASIWDTGPYQGYADDPDLQLRWFLDHAEAVKLQRRSAGLALDARHYGEWIADVERPAEQYRGRYQLRLEEARSLLEGASRASASAAHANDAHVLSVPDGLDADVADLAGQRAGIVSHARSFVGTPYVWGGSTPSGFDCSGFVQYVYRQVGVELPRVSYQQANTGQRVPLQALRPGDLVAWDNSSRNSGADHIAIYVGHGQVAEAPRTGIDLRIRTLGSDEGAWGVRILGRRG